MPLYSYLVMWLPFLFEPGPNGFNEKWRGVQRLSRFCTSIFSTCICHSFIIKIYALHIFIWCLNLIVGLYFFRYCSILFMHSSYVSNPCFGRHSVAGLDLGMNFHDGLEFSGKSGRSSLLSKLMFWVSMELSSILFKNDKSFQCCIFISKHFIIHSY